MTQSYEEFTIDEHEEIDAATVIFEETAALIKSALTDIQVLINQAYDELQANQSLNTIDPNAGRGQRGTTGGTPKPKPAKIDHTLKPGGKLTTLQRYTATLHLCYDSKAVNLVCLHLRVAYCY